MNVKKYCVFSVPTDISDMHIQPSVLKGLAWSSDYCIQHTWKGSYSYIKPILLTVTENATKRMKGVVFFRE